MENKEYGLNTILTMKKGHPCGANEWQIVRLGADINLQNKQGISPLMWAVIQNENPEIISVLLQNGANPKLKNKQGYTALDLATENKHLINTPQFLELKKSFFTQN